MRRRYLQRWGGYPTNLHIPPAVNTHFRIASNTKTMTAAVIVLLAQDGKLKFSDPVSDLRSGCAQRREHHRRRAAEDAQRALQLHRRRPSSRPTLDADPAKAWTPQEVLDIAFRHPPQFAPDTVLRVQQHQLRTAGPDRREGRRAPVGAAVPGPAVRAARPAADVASRRRRHLHPGALLPRLHVRRKLSTHSADDPYPADMQAAARAGTLQPIDYTNQNSSYATAAGGAISTADDLATWMQALVSGKVFNADYPPTVADSLQAEDPDAPDGQKYGYGISYQRFGPNAAMYYHGGEMPGFNSFMGYDPDNDVTLVIWTNLTLSPDGKTTAQAMLADSARRDLRRPVAGATADSDDHKVAD